MQNFYFEKQNVIHKNKKIYTFYQKKKKKKKKKIFLKFYTTKGRRHVKVRVKINK